jgi:extracellular matrix regulatory protein B
MYLHVGEEVLVRTRDIIAILEIDSANSSPYMEEFMTRQNQQVVHLAKGAVKSIVVTGNHIYYSPLASGTLKKRSQKLSVQEF